MAGDRYVVLGLACPRADWFTAVARWATSGALPVEFRKCLSSEELRLRLAEPRPASALLVDGGHPAFDRELEIAARRAGCAVLVVEPCRAEMTADALLPAALTREALLDALAGCAELVSAAAEVPSDDGAVPIGVQRGMLIAVCGPGGTGASTAAAATAQGLACDGRWGQVVLADLALHADQALLHDVRDVAPGLQELVEAHRYADPGEDEVRRLAFHPPDRGYELLLGLRRARQWGLLRARPLAAAVETLRRCYGAVVCDVAPDVEGEEQGGSPEVEHRNLLARTGVLAADAVVVVGRPGVKGLHALVRLLVELGDAGVEPGRLVPAFMCVPRSPRHRSHLAVALADLSGPPLGAATAPAVFLPVRRVDDSVRDGRPVPDPLPGILARSVSTVVERAGPRVASPQLVPVPVAPGSLGLEGEEA